MQTVIFGLCKLKASGSFDSSFGTNGRYVMESYLPHTFALGIKTLAVQADGEIVVMAAAQQYSAAFIVKFKATGIPDSSFGFNGYSELVPPGLSTGIHTRFTEMVMQPDGKFLFGGNGYDNGGFVYGIIIRVRNNGNFDSSFNGNGIVEMPASSGYKLSGSIALQTDGKIVMAGVSNNFSNNYDFAAARVNTNGSLDASFDGDGYAPVPLTNNADVALMPCIQTDGKIILSGYYNDGKKDMLALTRLSATGQPDMGFGSNSKTIAEIGSSSDDYNSLAIYLQPDQKILNLRMCGSGTSWSILLSRHLSSGAPDSAFGSNGKTYYPLMGVSYIDKAAIYQAPNGKILTIFSAFTELDGEKMMLVQFQGNGRLDSSFGIYGRKEVSLGLPYLVGPTTQAVIVDTLAARIYISYYRSSGYASIYDTFYLARINVDGTYDNSFGTNGKITMKSSGLTVALQTNGKIVCGGISNLGYHLRRYNANGSVDLSFNNGDSVSTGLNGPSLMFTIQSDNKILVIDGIDRVRRFNVNGTIDSSYGVNGLSTMAYKDGFYRSMAIQPDGKLLLAGSGFYQFTNEYYYSFVMLRLQTNGSSDTGFGIQGRREMDRDTTGTSWGQICVQADGKIIVTGNTDTWDYSEPPYQYWRYYTGYIFGGNGHTFTMARFNNSGTPSNGYAFTGNGNWNLPGNWSNGMLPPTPLPNGSEVTIDPSSGSCILNVPQAIDAGGKITVKTGKTFIVQGNLTIH
ncbi:MAG: hypothetical protein ABIX01_15840 [Chitinophagaceae bacterium]